MTGTRQFDDSARRASEAADRNPSGFRHRAEAVLPTASLRASSLKDKMARRDVKMLGAIERLVRRGA
jgi:hypothetical protein